MLNEVLKNQHIHFIAATQILIPLDCFPLLKSCYSGQHNSVHLQPRTQEEKLTGGPLSLRPACQRHHIETLFQKQTKEPQLSKGKEFFLLVFESTRYYISSIQALNCVLHCMCSYSLADCIFYFSLVQ